MPDTEPATVTVYGQSITLLVTGQPDIKNKYGSGDIRPVSIRLEYRDSSIRAQVYGRWVREDGEVTDAPVDQDYQAPTGDLTSWPDWLAGLAVSARPAAAPVDRAAIYREVADRLAADAEQGEKEGFTRIYRRSAAKQVRDWADEAQAAVDPSWPRRAWNLGLLHKGGDPHHCPACLKQPEPPANFVCPGDNTEVLANPQPAEEA